MCASYSHPCPVSCAEILEADVEKTIRIVVTSKLVNYDRFLGSLKESLQPLCEKVRTVLWCSEGLIITAVVIVVNLSHANHLRCND